MNHEKRRKSWQGTKIACIGLTACSLLLPSGIAGAANGTGNAGSSDTVSVSEKANNASYDQLSIETRLKIAAGEIPMPESNTPDPALAKFSKEQAIAKVKELFPALKEAVAQNVGLGVNNVYPPPSNQMVWDIQWQYEAGNTSYGFSSTVDAMTGELISTSLNIPQETNSSYYPPKLTKEQAMETAKSFITKAAPSISIQDLVSQENSGWYGEAALFGPVQYNFYFQLKKNGILSSAEYVHVTVDGNGSVASFSKSAEQLDYPKGPAKISQAAAEQAYKDELQVELSYIPVRKDGKVSEWILGWRPAESASYPLDALTGKRFDYQGKDITPDPAVYIEVPSGKQQFQPRTAVKEMTADEAVKVIKQVAAIPDGRTLQYSSLDQDYMNPERKIWRLTWGEETGMSRGWMPSSQTSAEVDALTGQILEYRVENYGVQGNQTTSSAPSGSTKLTVETAKSRANEWLNRLVPNASRDYKLVGKKGETHMNAEETGYRYEFVRFVQGLPVNDLQISITLDLYGQLQYYSVGRTQGLENITIKPQDAKVTKEAALEAYSNRYTFGLQYMSVGGYYIDNTFMEQQVRLAYTPETKDPQQVYQVLDAVSGKWTTVYDNGRETASTIVPSDLKGHSAEGDLSTLLQYGVIAPDVDGKVKPDESITVGEWLNMISKAVTPYYKDYSGTYGLTERKEILGVVPESPYYDAVSYSAKQKWIDADHVLKVDEKLTREELAGLLVSFVKYNKLAAFLTDDAGLNQFHDKSSIVSKGEVALAVKLGLLQGQSGSFNPKGTVTRAEAASVIMRLVKLQGKTDQAISQ